MKRSVYTGLLLTLSSLFLRCTSNPQDPNLEANRALVEKYFQAWNAGQVADLDQIMTPDVIDHSSSGKDYKGIGLMKDWITKMRAASPDMKDEIVDIVAQGNLVVVRGKTAGTYHGHYKGVEVTGKKYVLYNSTMYRIANGKIAEEWDFQNDTILDKQLLTTK